MEEKTETRVVSSWEFTTFLTFPSFYLFFPPDLNSPADTFSCGFRQIADFHRIFLFNSKILILILPGWKFFP